MTRDRQQRRRARRFAGLSRSSMGKRIAQNDAGNDCSSSGSRNAEELRKRKSLWRAHWATGSGSDLGVREGGFPVGEDRGMTSVQPSRRTSWFADLKAEALAWWVTRSSERRLSSVMRGRLRGVMLWQIFRTIRQRAQPDTRVDAVVEFRITDRRDGGIDRYQVRLADGRGCRPRRDARRPALTLELEPVAFLRLVGGAASAERLLIAGKLKLRGDLVLALALPTALRIPRRRPRTPRQR